MVKTKDKTTKLLTVHLIPNPPLWALPLPLPLPTPPCCSRLPLPAPCSSCRPVTGMILTRGAWWNSVFEFIMQSAFEIMIRTASLTCRTRGLLWTLITFMLNSALMPPCCTRQCFHKAFSSSSSLRASLCSIPLVKAFLAALLHNLYTFQPLFPTLILVRSLPDMADEEEKPEMSLWRPPSHSLYAVYCTLYTLHLTMYTLQYTLFTIHCTLYTVLCTLYT